MSIKINNTGIRAARKEIKIKFRKFPEIYDEFLGNTTHDDDEAISTPQIEEAGAKLMKDLTLDDERAYDFALLVFKWGGTTGRRLKGKISYHNGGEEKAIKELAKGIWDAIDSLKNGTCADAIFAIKKVKGLGTSYGSKILRMLAPEKAVAYDSVLQKNLRYGDTDAAYQEFCNSCVQVAAILNRDKILKKDKTRPYRWRAADVEAVIFEVLHRGF